MSLYYHPLHLADIAVHRLPAHPVLPVPLQHGSKLVGCPPAAEPDPGLRILHQPIDAPP
jgi:hypothetical protein